MPTSREPVLYRRQGRTGIITLNRPERLNAINIALLEGLIGRLKTAAEDRGAAVVVLTGAGERAFCAGQDLKETAPEDDLAAWSQEVDLLQDVQRVILRLGKPLIAAVNGYALGGGCEFAMSCDLRIAAPNARFGFPETGVGLTVTTAGTKLLTQLVGLGKAKELIFTGDFVDADEALRIGLVNRIAPAEELMQATLAMADRIARHSPLALKLSRMAIDQGLDATFEQTLEIEANHLLICAQNQQGRVQGRLAELKQKGHPE